MSTNLSAGDPSFYSNTSSSIPGMTISNIYATGSNQSMITLDLKNNNDFKSLLDRIDTIERQLCILKPDEVLQEKYPALQEAYDAYQLILKIVNDQNKR